MECVSQRDKHIYSPLKKMTNGDAAYYYLTFAIDLISGEKSNYRFEVWIDRLEVANTSIQSHSVFIKTTHKKSLNQIFIV